MKFVESKDLRPGMRLAKPIYNKMGVMLYDRNSYLTMSGIKSIENFGLIGLFILEPAEPLPPVSQEDLEFEQFQIVYMFRIKDIMDRLQKEQDPEGLPELTLEILKQFGSLSRKRNFIQTLRSSVDFVYRHAISSAILSAMISNMMGFSQKEKINLVTAALLYDLGYLYVPRNIMEKADWSPDDQHVVNECWKKGFQLLFPDTNKYMLPAEVLNTIQQTLSFMSAPNAESLKEKPISKYAKALVVADRFNRLTAMNLHHAPVSEVSAIRSLRNSPDLYNPMAVSALANSIRVLPSGCSIDFTNGDKGIVLVDNPTNFLAPVVLNFRDNQIYDLSDPAVSAQIQIADIMKTMDNRIVVDEETLKQFSSDEKLSRTLARFRKQMQEKMKKYESRKTANA